MALVTEMKEIFTMKYREIIFVFLIFYTGISKADTTNIKDLNLANDYSQVDLYTGTNEKNITEIAKVYQASLVYIFDKQLLINNQKKNKNVLFGQPFINNVKRTYKGMFNQPFPQSTNRHVGNLLTLMMLVMEDNRTLLLDDGISFKGFIPAIFAFQLSQKFKERGVGLNIKFTNFEERVRNKLNSPDHWEEGALAKLKDGRVDEVFDEGVSFKGQDAYRYMKAVKMSPMCLSCHGIPQDNPANKGVRKEQWHLKDKTGFFMEGWILDELGGGISVVLYKGKHNVYKEK